jgi:hypothetical protein
MRTFYMLRNTFLAVLTVLTVAAASQAAVTINATSVDTPGLSGFRTWTLTAASDDPVTAIDFVGDGNNDPASGRGFFGPLNQLMAAGMPTPWQDFNAFLPQPDGPMQDTQFMVVSGQVVVPAGLAEENGNLLQGAWAWSVSPGNSVPFAQLVIPSEGTVNYRGAVTALVNGVQTDFPVSGMVPMGTGGVPPVAVDAPSLAGTAGALFSHQFTTSAGDTPITWEGLTKVSGPDAPNAPTLSGTGLFEWNAARAPIGTFVWDVTARNTAGTDVGRISIEVVIPEPATISLISLAMIGLAGIFRRHR